MNIKYINKLTIQLVIVTLVVAYFVYSNIQKQKQIDSLSKETNEQTLTRLIKEETKGLKDKQELITKLQKEVSDWTWKNNCLKTQLNRMFEGMEYSIEYCNNKDNILKFVGL